MASDRICNTSGEMAKRKLGDVKKKKKNREKYVYSKEYIPENKNSEMK